MALDRLRRTGFAEITDCVENGLCPLCGLKIVNSEFRNKDGLREYLISGLCQSCQDDVFGGYAE